MPYRSDLMIGGWDQPRSLSEIRTMKCSRNPRVEWFDVHVTNDEISTDGWQPATLLHLRVTSFLRQGTFVWLENLEEVPTKRDLARVVRGDRARSSQFASTAKKLLDYMRVTP